MKIALTNNYDMVGIRNSWLLESTNAPTQHMWGYAELTRMGHQVDLIPTSRLRWLKKISDRIKILGDIEAQIRIFSRSGSYDVIYSGHHLTTSLLSALRQLGIFRTPLISIAYQVPRISSLLSQLHTRLFVSGNDRLLCLSGQLLVDFNALGVPLNKLSSVSWGVDLPHYNFSPSQARALTASSNNRPFILSPGKSFRDYKTLASGIRDVDGCDLIVTGCPSIAQHDYMLSTPNARVVTDFLPWRELIALYHQSLAVAIPVDTNAGHFNNAIGFTNATEALACGRPLIATRNPYLGIDVELERVGILVSPGDSAGWRNAIEYLLANPAESVRMGERARALAESKFNIGAFAGQINNVIHDIARPS